MEGFELIHVYEPYSYITEHGQSVTEDGYYKLSIDGSLFGCFGHDAFEGKNTDEVLEIITILLNETLKLGNAKE